MLPLESVHNCDLRETHIPNFPVFPDASLVSQTDVLNTSKNRIVQYNYETESDIDEILQFYKDQSLCDVTLRCEGKAERFGRYTVFISETSLTIELAWDKCGVNWEKFNSVE
jgi:hypothetical protein